jgi:CheY-like chemotaxis protein
VQVADFGQEANCAGRVALVDDDVEFLDDLAGYLRGVGFAVITCERPSLAIRFVRRLQPEALLLDFDMPGRSGLQILEELRAGSSTHEIPVLLLTAHDQPEVRRGGWSRQLDDFIPKLTDRDELSLRLRRAIERRRLDRDRSAGWSGFSGGVRAQLALNDLLRTDYGESGADWPGPALYVLQLPALHLLANSDRPELLGAYLTCFRALAHRIRDNLVRSARRTLSEVPACEAGPDWVVFGVLDGTAGPASGDDALLRARLGRRVQVANRLLRSLALGARDFLVALPDQGLVRRGLPRFRLLEFRFPGRATLDWSICALLTADIIAETPADSDVVPLRYYEL